MGWLVGIILLLFKIMISLAVDDIIIIFWMFYFCSLCFTSSYAKRCSTIPKSLESEKDCSSFGLKAENIQGRENVVLFWTQFVSDIFYYTCTETALSQICTRAAVWAKRAFEFGFLVFCNLNFVLMPPLLLGPRPTQSKVGCVNRSSDMSSGKWKSVSSTELAQSIDNGGAGNSAEILIVDCRSLVAFNGLHIRGAIHVNCTGIGRKRLSQGKAKLKDLISSAEGKEKFIRGGVGTTFVIYDELSSDPEDCNPCRPICLVLQNLLKEGRNISVLKGKSCSWHFLLF